MAIVPETLSTALDHHIAGRLAEAEGLYRLNQAKLYDGLGWYAQAAASYCAALQRRSDQPEAWSGSPCALIVALDGWPTLIHGVRRYCETDPGGDKITVGRRRERRRRRPNYDDAG